MMNDGRKPKNKAGNESLEPRRTSVPLPGSEAQALTPAYRKMIKRLDDKVELLQVTREALSHVTNSISSTYIYVESS